MPCAAAERHAGAAAQSPQHAADKAEHMPQRQQTEESVLRTERELGRAVERALAEGVIRQYDGLGLLSRAGGEKEDLAGTIGHAAGQSRGELLYKINVAPEHVGVRVDDELFQQLLRRVLVEHHDLHSGEVRSEELDHAVKTAV